MCIVSVLVGTKYKKFAEMFCKSYEISTNVNNRVEVIFYNIIITKIIF